MEINEIKTLLRIYVETSAVLFGKFGINDVDGDIVDKTNEKWDYSDESVCWLDSKGDLYVEDIRRGPVEFENFRLFYIDDSCGNRFYQIYDIQNRDEEIYW